MALAIIILFIIFLIGVWQEDFAILLPALAFGTIITAITLCTM